MFFYLYMIVDVWSRKVVGWAVHEVESASLAAALFEETCVLMKLDPTGLVLHADNGGPMKGSTMVATLERLGVLPSFSRPHVSNDNPFSEGLFRTLKYRPNYPTKPFANVVVARAWVLGFVGWYNGVHLHSGIRFVTPNDRHAGKEKAILERRHRVYVQARESNKARWSGPARNWTPVEVVYLNPDEDMRELSSSAALLREPLYDNNLDTHRATSRSPPPLPLVLCRSRSLDEPKQGLRLSREQRIKHRGDATPTTLKAANDEDSSRWARATRPHSGRPAGGGHDGKKPR